MTRRNKIVPRGTIIDYTIAHYTSGIITRIKTVYKSHGFKETVYRSRRHFLARTAADDKAAKPDRVGLFPYLVDVLDAVTPLTGFSLSQTSTDEVKNLKIRSLPAVEVIMGTLTAGELEAYAEELEALDLMQKTILSKLSLLIEGRQEEKPIDVLVDWGTDIEEGADAIRPVAAKLAAEYLLDGITRALELGKLAEYSQAIEQLELALELPELPLNIRKELSGLLSTVQQAMEDVAKFAADDATDYDAGRALRPVPETAALPLNPASQPKEGLSLPPAGADQVGARASGRRGLAPTGGEQSAAPTVVGAAKAAAPTVVGAAKAAAPTVVGAAKAAAPTVGAAKAVAPTVGAAKAAAPTEGAATAAAPTEGAATAAAPTEGAAKAAAPEESVDEQLSLLRGQMAPVAYKQAREVIVAGAEAKAVAKSLTALIKERNVLLRLENGIEISLEDFLLIIDHSYGSETIANGGAKLPPVVAFSKEVVFTRAEILKLFSDFRENISFLARTSSVLRKQEAPLLWSTGQLVEVAYYCKDRSRSVSENSYTEIRKVNEADLANLKRVKDQNIDSKALELTSNYVVFKQGQMQAVYCTETDGIFERLNNATVGYPNVKNSFLFAILENTGVTKANFDSALREFFETYFYPLMPTSVVGESIIYRLVDSTNTRKAKNLEMHQAVLKGTGKLDDYRHIAALQKFVFVGTSSNVTSGRNRLRFEIEGVSQRLNSYKQMETEMIAYEGLLNAAGQLKNQAKSLVDDVDHVRNVQRLAERLSRPLMVTGGNDVNARIKRLQELSKKFAVDLPVNGAIGGGHLILQLVKRSQMAGAVNGVVVIDQLDAVGFDASTTEKYRTRFKHEPAFLADLGSFSTAAAALGGNIGPEI